MERRPRLEAIGLQQRERGKPKASQIRGAPDFPVQNLYPCFMTEGVTWSIDPRLLLSVGLFFEQTGMASYAPAMVSRMRIKSFRVWTHVDAFDPEATFSLTMRYLDKEEKAHEQFTRQFRAGDEETPDRLVFDVPLEHLDPDGWFTCSMGVELHTPLVGEERERAVRSGRENPMMPVLQRGAWLEIKG